MEILFDANLDDAGICEYLARELKLRKQTARVIQLHRRVLQKISVGFRVIDTVAQATGEKDGKKPDEPGLLVSLWLRIKRFFRF